MFNNVLVNMLNQIRNRLKVRLPDGSAAARQIPDDSAEMLRVAARTADDTDQNFHRLLSAKELNRQLEADAIRRSADKRFDPALPVSVHNMPKWDDLEYDTGIGGEGYNYLIRHNGKPIGIYKIRHSTSRIRDEVGMWEADQVLGLDIVPYTRRWNGPLGEGSLQEYVPNSGPALHTNTLEGQRVAALDYIMASGDRHLKNALVRTDRPGKLAATDNEGLLPPKTTNNSTMMRSEFVAAHIGKPLDPDLVKQLRTVDPAGFSEHLQTVGYPRDIADWSAERLKEIQKEGMITGDAWGCAIMREDMRIVYPPGYNNLLEYWKDHPPNASEFT
ncbi:hypothetical protein [Nocardia australiensis]|uniref:hypothetical protein n=1 Tax=Nocardia australiensis TaxID=2887191 RepID=UPI001D159466|nr:hypothetical protein [Nocardia australiensis]